MSLIKDLITAIRYYNSLDPYHRDVDNRPLNDLGNNQGVMADGLDTGLLSQKVVSAAAGFIARGLLGENMAVGKTEISGWTFKVKRLLAVMNKVASGTDSRLVPELSLWSEQLAPSGTGEGIFAVGQHATLYNMYSIRVTTGLALTTKTPFYDATLNTYFPQVCEVQQASFVLASSQSAVPPGEPAWAALGAIGSDQLEVIRILVPPATLGAETAVTSSMVTHMSYQEEGAFGSSGGGGTGDFLTLPRAKVYGLSNSGDGSADNLILVNPLLDADFDDTVHAGVYGLNATQVTSVLNSPVTEHTTQIGTWGPGVLRVMPCDVVLVQTLTLTRRLDDGDGNFYEAVEEWIRTQVSSTWSAWDLVSTTKSAPIEVYDTVAGKTVTLNRPASNKAIIRLIGAGGGGGGGGALEPAGWAGGGGYGGASGALLILEVTFNRDILPDQEIEVHTGATTLPGAGAIVGVNHGTAGVDGDDTWIRFSGHEFRVPGGNGGQSVNKNYHSFGDARSSVGNSVPPIVSVTSCVQMSNVLVSSDFSQSQHLIRWPVFKPYYASTLYTQDATDQEKLDAHAPLKLSKGDVIDLWDTAGVRVKVLKAIPTIRMWTYPYILSPNYKYTWAHDGTRGGVVHPGIPETAYAHYLSFDPYYADNLTEYMGHLWGAAPYNMLDPWKGPQKLVQGRGGVAQFYVYTGARQGADYVQGMGLPLAAKGGYAPVAYGASGTEHAWQVETNGIGRGEHAPATAWGYGGGGGGSSTSDSLTDPASGHVYTAEEDPGVGVSGVPIPGTLQRGYPGGRGAAGYASIKPLI